MNIKRRILTIFLVLVLCAATLTPALADAPVTGEATILFTHDLHSHLLPATDSNGKSYGGYARLKPVIDEQKKENPDAVLVDGGDFAMGSLFQAGFSSTASELRIMGALGYDATTFGNHEYDYRDTGLAKMLNAAVASGDTLPKIVEANYYPPEKGAEGYTESSEAVWNALENYGVEKYILFERGGIWYGIFGLMGYESHDYAPMSGMVLADPIETAQKTVDEMTQKCWDENGVQPLVICLSHSGTEGGEGEDYELAKEVDGIDLIVSGHSHTLLSEPIQVNDTWIVSCAEYSKNLGVVTMDYKPNGDSYLTDYELIPIDDTVPENEEISALVESYKAEVEQSYLTKFNMGFDEVLVNNPYKFDTVDEVYATAHESTLGNLLSDAYRWAAEEATGEEIDAAFTASGVIRESFAIGDVTTSQVFNVASLGIGADEVPGYPIIKVYLTGADLKNVMEVDASVYPIMNAAQLFSSGIEYSFNQNRMLFNKVDYSAIRKDDGTTEEIVDDELYSVVTGLYCGQMLGSVQAKSFGLLSVTARDENGNPIDMDNLEAYIVHREDGTELKEWHAIATYLQSMDGEIDEKYSSPDGRKMVYKSLNPIKLLRNANKFTYIILLVILVIIAVIVLIVRGISRRKKRKKSKKA